MIVFIDYYTAIRLYTYLFIIYFNKIQAKAETHVVSHMILTYNNILKRINNNNNKRPSRIPINEKFMLVGFQEILGDRGDILIDD